MFYIIYTHSNNQLGSRAVSDLLARKLNISLFNLDRHIENLEDCGCFVDNSGLEDIEGHILYLLSQKETGVVEADEHLLAAEVLECIDTYGGKVLYIPISANDHDIIETYIENSDYEVDHSDIGHEELEPFYRFSVDGHVDEQIEECVYRLKKLMMMA